MTDERSILYLLLDRMYSMPQEAYEEYIDENPEAWKVPYDALKEYLPAICIVSNATYSQQAIINFFDYYFKNQKEYPEQYRITSVEKVWTQKIITKEATRGEFWENIRIYKRQGFITESDLSKFMQDKAEEFLEVKKPGKLPKLEAMLNGILTL